MDRISNTLLWSLMKLTQLLRCTYYKNFPKRYVEREKGVIPERVNRNRFGAPDIPENKIKAEDYEPTEHRPWEMENKMRQISRMRKLMGDEELEKSTLPTPIADDRWWIFRGDRVKVLVGKDKGKVGTVNYVVRDLNHVYVAGLNCKCEWKENPSLGPKGGAYSMVERPLVVPDQVALIEPWDYQVTNEVEWEFTAGGERVRKSMRTGRIIHIRAEADEAYEYKVAGSYSECAKDTAGDLVEKITYEPTIQSFEEEILDDVGVADKRQRKKTYWY